MNKLFSILILLSALSFAQSPKKDIADYCRALAGELEAYKKYLVECEAKHRDFILQSQDRENALAKDNATLKAEIEKLLRQKQRLLAEQARLASERQALTQTHAECERPIAQAEQTLETKKALLPKSLGETLLPPLEGGDLTARLRRFLDSLQAIQEFSLQSPPPISQVMKGPDGIEREYHVLHFGLSLAYAVSDEAKIAGMGQRQGAEWNWHWNSEWYPDISKIVEIRLGKRPPELLHLPLPPIPDGGEAK